MRRYRFWVRGEEGVWGGGGGEEKKNPLKLRGKQRFSKIPLLSLIAPTVSLQVQEQKASTQ